MKYKVVQKQPNSRMCIVCGLRNVMGLRASFYELENGELVGIFTPRKEHQGFPGRLHGGIVTAILDETINRTVLNCSDETTWAVTLEFTTRFQKPVPLDEELRVVGRVTEENRRFFSGSGEILLSDGTVAATGKGRFLKLSTEQLGVFDPEREEWGIVAGPDPTSIDLKEGGA